MRHVLPTLVACVTLPATFGCSANLAASADAVDADSNATSAVVVIERTVAADAKADARGSAVARFVRMRSGAVDDDALRLVGATVDFPALGTCGSTTQPGPSPRASTARAVELLDVGALSLEAAGQRTNLQARQIPDVVDLLSGVVYATQTADADALPPHSDYLLRAAGSADLDVSPFAVHASAPDELQALRIAGREMAGIDGNATAASFAADEAVDLAWTAGSPDDVIYVDVAASSTGEAERSPTARCLFSDDGKATLRPAVFGAATSGTLTLHRLHSEPFRVKGVDTGEVRFDFAVVVPFTRS